MYFHKQNRVAFSIAKFPQNALRKNLRKSRKSRNASWGNVTTITKLNVNRASSNMAAPVAKCKQKAAMIISKFHNNQSIKKIMFGTVRKSKKSFH